MSILKLYERPYVAYDPSNETHRKYFYEFIKHKTWGKCPVRFVIEDELGADFVSTMKLRTLEYYMNKEFKG